MTKKMTLGIALIHLQNKSINRFQNDGKTSLK